MRSGWCSSGLPVVDSHKCLSRALGIASLDANYSCRALQVPTRRTSADQRLRGLGLFRCVTREGLLFC